MNPKLSLIVAMLIFGSIGLFVREIDLASSQIALIRGILGSIFLLLFGVLMKRKISWLTVRKNLLLLLLSGVGIGLNWLFLFEAYKYTTIANATLSYYFAPLFVILLSPVILKERLTALKVFCVLGAVLGMFLVVGFDVSSGNTLVIGIGYGLLAAVFYASVIIINKFMHGLTGLEATLFQLFFAVVIILPYVGFTEGFSFAGVGVTSWILVTIVGIIHTGLGYLLYFSSIQKLSSQTVASLSYIDPVSAIIMASILLGEHLGFIQVIGAVLILGVTFISDRYGDKKVTHCL